MAKKDVKQDDFFVGMDFSNKCVALNAETKCLQYDELDYTPRSIPLGQILGETTNDMIEKILLHSGAISRQQWENFKGISYDVLDEGDEFFDDDDFAEADDDFELSSYSKYDVTESNTEVIPPKEYGDNEPPLPNLDTPNPPSADSSTATQATNSTTETQA